MVDDFIRDLRLLLKADALIGKIWVRCMVRQFGLFAFAGLIAVFGLAMADVAGFYALQASLGPIWAAALMAIGDFVLAAMVMLIGRNSQPGPEIDQAFDIRKMAIESLQVDARELKVTVDTFGQEIQDAKDSIAGFLHNPLDAAVQDLLIPAATSIIRELCSKKD
jgi:putative superfamily III holin-X